MVNAMGMKFVSQEWQRQLKFLFCPSSPQSIPRTTGILFNNVLLLQRTSITSMFCTSPVYDLSFPTLLPHPVASKCAVPLRQFVFYYRSHISTGIFLWAMAHGKTCSIYSADSPEPNTDCIPPQHCPKADATYFTVPPVSLFVVNLYHFRGTFL